jgi:hypothetical protein
MGVSVLDEIVGGRGPAIVPLTVEQFQRMVETGVLCEGEPIELVDGLLVRRDRSSIGGDPMAHGPRHAAVVSALQELNVRLSPLGFHARSQLPVTLGVIQSPEPDLAIVLGTRANYQDRHPTAEEVAATITSPVKRSN